MSLSAGYRHLSRLDCCVPCKADTINQRWADRYEAIRANKIIDDVDITK